MAVTLPIVGDSEGTWGTTLNTAITDIDTRLVTATNVNAQQTSDITSHNNRLNALEVPIIVSVQNADVTDQTANNGTSSLGAPTVGCAFTCPTSGRVRISLSAGIRITTIGTGAIYVGCRIRTGATVGAGTDVVDLMNAEPGCRVALSGYAGFVMSGTATMVDTVTYPRFVAGSTYNVSVWHFVTSGTLGTIMYRQVGVDPLP